MRASYGERAALLRRLTHTEYDNTAHDFLDDTNAPARAFATDTEVGLFDNTASAQTVPVLLADQYLEAAATLAEGISVCSALVHGTENPEAGARYRALTARANRRASCDTPRRLEPLEAYGSRAF